MSSNVYIIAGPNGAGKTTFAREFLPKYADCKNFINADMIAAGLSPFSPELAAIRAGRLMLEEIELSKEKRADFGFETTLSGRGHLGVIRSLREHGYQVHFFYLWVPSVELTLARIKERVLRGGHDVPEAVARRRFDRSITNFLVHYRLLAEKWTLFDNSAATPALIASSRNAQLRVVDARAYNDLVVRYGAK